MAKGHNLHLLNSEEKCKGKMTRHRKTKVSEEKSILDFIFVCDVLKKCLKMKKEHLF